MKHLLSLLSVLVIAAFPAKAETRGHDNHGDDDDVNRLVCSGAVGGDGRSRKQRCAAGRGRQRRVIFIIAGRTWRGLITALF